MTTYRVRPMGTRAWLVECEPAEAPALARDLLARPVPGQESVRVGARTVLVTVRGADARAARRALEARTVAGPTAMTASRGRHVVDVVYDGADREELALRLGLSVEALVDRHQDQEWTVAFMGFAPGFAYLRGWELDVPRLGSPRSSVPAGAVAVAGPFSAVYPTSSPGGWRLLGRTPAPVWDLERDPPALFEPGDTVRYRAVRDVVRLAAAAGGPGAAPLAEWSSAPRAEPPAEPPTEPRPAPSTPPPAAPGAVTVLDPGLLTLVEDLGRPGLEHLGVSPSGAADAGAARRANRLVGNDRRCAVLETLGGLRLHAERDLVVAVTGAPADLLVDTEPVPPDGPFPVSAGQVLSIGYPHRGLRCYVALRGGVDVPPVLGSRSTDVLAGLGPAPLAPGARLDLGTAREAVGLPEGSAGPADRPTVTSVRVALGPRDEEFGPAGVEALTGQDWVVSATSNRVGLRLEGTPLDRLGGGELASEPMVRGAIQVPPSGLPVVLLTDHPVTGGYPVVAVVLTDDLDLLAQVRPGERLRLLACPSPAIMDKGPSAQIASTRPT